MKEIGTCKECRWWDRTNSMIEMFTKSSDYGICSHGKFNYCEGFSQFNGTTDDYLVYCDGEGYHASFETGADFGCIHWEGE